MFGKKARGRRKQRREDRRQFKLDKRQQRQDAKFARVDARQQTKQIAYEAGQNPNQWASDVADAAADFGGAYMNAKSSMFGAQLGADNTQAALAAGMNPFPGAGGSAKDNPSGSGTMGGESMMPLALGALGLYLVTKNKVKMIDALRRFAKILQALTKLVPVIIDVISDFADDGKRNNSNAKQVAKSAPAGTDSTTS